MARALHAVCTDIAVCLRTAKKHRGRPCERPRRYFNVADYEWASYFARLIVNLPNEMPSSTPSPAPASASETVPLVMT
jgi:hypothetical protein